MSSVVRKERALIKGQTTAACQMGYLNSQPYAYHCATFFPWWEKISNVNIKVSLSLSLFSSWSLSLSNSCYSQLQIAYFSSPPGFKQIQHHQVVAIEFSPLLTQLHLPPSCLFHMWWEVMTFLTVPQLCTSNL